MINTSFLIFISYFIGSIPTALIVGRIVANVDIREIGDGNMGARNVTRMLGWFPGMVVAAIDFGKGALPILIGRNFELDLFSQILCGVCAVLGHDFPIWAKFHGGQGMASILGMLFVLMPGYTIWSLIIFLIAYLITRIFDISAGLGLGTLAFLVWFNKEHHFMLYFVICCFLTIPFKKILDLPRRRRIRDKNLFTSEKS